METGSLLGDLLSIFLSIGSPVWVCSSLAYAVLFRRAVHKRFEHLRALSTNSPCQSAKKHLLQKYNAAETIFKSLLQAPVRLSSRPGFLSSLIALPQNLHWWVIAAAKITAGQRRVDAPYIGQNAIAALCWLLSIIANFGNTPGGLEGNPNSTEWLVFMGTVFLWLVSTFS
jgi:hypothetical protein